MTSATLKAPTVETERLILRRHDLDDVDASAEMWADPAVVRYIGGKPSTRQQVWARILSYAGHWSYKNFGYWAIEERATGAFVGEVGFADFKRDVIAAMRGVPEMGWALVSRVHGRGLGAEAVRAALGWGDANLESPRTVCLIDGGNAASLRIAEKCGFTTFEYATYDDRPTHFAQRDRERYGNL